jgi:antitoxin HigA-1
MPTKSASKTITRDQRWLGPAIRPGKMLLEEYLKPLGIGQLEAVRKIGVSLNRLNEIILGQRGITANTALRLARFLKTSPELLMRGGLGPPSGHFFPRSHSVIGSGGLQAIARLSPRVGTDTTLSKSPQHD